ncbi:MAG: RNA polymerase sigma-54 factor, partial [Lachnospiraceae bacterium]|nr:RNA polymerase sigma-54 factor [Lachnospiraceae bacterium]
ILNDYMYPKMSINEYYRQLAKQDEAGEARMYINQKIHQAQWIMSCIDQRNSTLMNVTGVILQKQDEFFACGRKGLKPMRLIDAAEELGIHESTVSRAIKDKYLQCIWGVFPMSYFFSKGLSVGKTEEGISTDNVKAMIRNIIENEDKNKPFSDRVIAELLEKEGVKISRRTVAKYRECEGLRDTAGRRVY